MARKNFAVIGLGRFGMSVAITLAQEGAQVLAIDKEEARVNAVKDYVTTAYQTDSTDIDALKEVGITNCDVVVVGIGEDIDSSILAALNLKELGTRYIVAKAVNKQHGKVLEKIGADRIVYPEADTGKRLAWQLMESDVLEFIEISPQYSVKDVDVPKQFIKKTIKELHVGSQFNVLVLAISKGNERDVVPSTDTVFEKKDKITIVGRATDVNKFVEHFRLE